MANSIMCVGSVALDSTRTPFGSVEGALGGAASYFSYSASFFCPVHLVSVVGGDFPDSHWKFLAGHGIDMQGVRVEKAGKTFRYESEFSYDLYNRKTIATHLNVLEGYKPVVPAGARGCSHAYLATMPPAEQAHALAQLESPQLSFLDTIEYFIDNDLADLKKAVSMVDGVVLNDAEARKLTGENSLL